MFHKNYTMIHCDFNTLKKGSTFYERYLFGGDIHVVKYVVVELHNNDVLAMDNMGDVYTFYKSDFENNI